MIHDNFIKKLESEFEGEHLVILKSFDLFEIGKILCSFLNGNGGVLIIDAISQYKNQPVNWSQEPINQLEQYLIKSIIPTAPFSINSRTVVDVFGSMKIFVLKSSGGSKPPYLFEETIYSPGKGLKRYMLANTKQISELIRRRHEAEKHWERKIVVGVELEDLDKKLIVRTIKESKINHRSNFEGSDIYDFLSHYGLFQNGGFTNACVVLFGKNPSKFIPQIRVRLTEYSEGKTGKALLRDELLDGNLFEIRDKLEVYFEHLGVRSVFDDKQWKRRDFKFPSKALQEGVINALIHRDYSSISGGVSVEVYADKIEITNSGGLPDGLGIKELKKSHRSHPVNPDIAHIVFLRGLIDKLGKGTISVVELCKEGGLKTPDWKESNDGVTLTFNGPKSLPQKRSRTNEVNGKNNGNYSADVVIDAYNAGKNDGVSDGVSDGVNKSISEYFANSILKLSGQGKIEIIHIVDIVFTREGINAREIAEIRGKSKPTIERYLRQAKKAGLIEFNGAPKTGGYHLTKKIKDKLK